MEPKKIKSDGGSTPYYSIIIKGQPMVTGDIIHELVGDNFQLGNIIKAARRAWLASQGEGKEGSTVEYETNKIIYFAKDFADYNPTLPPEEE